MGIKAQPDLQSLKLAAEKAAKEGQEGIEFPVAAGVSPQRPQDGKIEWLGDFFSESYYIDPETHLIDFHQKTGIPAVEKDQLLVKIISPKEGQDGVDVFGKPCKAEKPKTTKIRPGSNVFWDDKENGFRAKCSGRVKLVGELLDVENIYRINGNVGADTGNIKHNGQLIIQGDIESGFKVEATGDIEVRGLVYPAEVICDGKLVVREGINENTSKLIKAKGGVVANYILNASIESDGPVAAKKEIFQSEIKTRDMVNCRDGRIAGGEVMAMKGIMVGEAGSKANVETTLIAGVDYQLHGKFKSNNEEMAKIKEYLKKLNPAAKKLKGNLRLLTDAQREIMTQITFKIAECEEQLEILENENKKLVEEIHKSKGAIIVIYNMIYPGVALRIYDAQHDTREILMGPITALYDKITSKIALTSELRDIKE